MNDEETLNDEEILAMLRTLSLDTLEAMAMDTFEVYHNPEADAEARAAARRLNGLVMQAVEDFISYIERVTQAIMNRSDGKETNGA